MRIAILAPTAAPALREVANPALRDGEDDVIGGAERQISMLGAAFKEAGHTVDILVAADGAEPWDSPSGRVWPRYPLAGLPLLKLIHPKGRAVLGWLRERESDVLLQRGASELTGLAVSAGRLAGVPSVFMLASDLDLDCGREILPHPQDHALFRESVRRVDRLVAQTQDQARRIWRQLGRNAVVLPSLRSSETVPPESKRGDAIIWGGNIRPVKRPEWLIELAHRFPDRRFLVYGGASPGAERYAATVTETFSKVPNLEYLGSVAPSELPGIYAQGQILLSTSEAEGFPNTFLEAWAGGLSVLATVDPDGLIQNEGLGRCATGLDALETCLAELLRESEKDRRARRERARSYLSKHHDNTRIIKKWLEVLDSLVGSGEGGA